MDYQISEVDFTDKEIDLKIRKLLQAAYNSNDLIDEFYVKRNISLRGNTNKSIFLVAHNGDEFIGCNGFIGNTFFLDGISRLCFQSCWSGTHPDHQRKGIFVNIQKKAETILSQRGAGMIFGLPNDNSRPIFVHKLDFLERDCNYVQIPSFLFLKFFINDKTFMTSNAGHIEADEKEVYMLKNNLRSGLLEFKVNDSYLWGKIATKNFLKIKIKYFDIGGMNIKEASDLERIFSKLKALNVAYFQFTSCAINRHNILFRHWRKSSNNPFIFKFLNFPKSDNINISLGAIDVF
jgi:hypothetical protein